MIAEFINLRLFTKYPQLVEEGPHTYKVYNKLHNFNTRCMPVCKKDILIQNNWANIRTKTVRSLQWKCILEGYCS